METYRPSGAAPLGGVVLALIAGLVTAALVGAAYPFAIAWIPFIYVNFLLTGVAGAAVGIAIAWGARAGKIRNSMVLSLVGLICGLLLCYVAWAIDPVARFGADNAPLAFRPAVLWGYKQLGYENGFWSIGRHGGTTVNGAVLAAVWITEAAFLVLASVWITRTVLDTPFCETCDKWTSTKNGVAWLRNMADVSTPMKQLLQGDLNALSQFPRSSKSAVESLRLDLHVCTECEKCNYMDVVRITHVKNAKSGKLEEKTNTVLTHLAVPTEQLALVINAGFEPQDEMPAAEPA